MNRKYLISRKGEPITLALSQPSAINAMYHEAAHYLIGFPDERDFAVKLVEDSDHNFTLALKARGEEVQTWTAKAMPVYQNEFSDNNLSPEKAIRHYVEFLDN